MSEDASLGAYRPEARDGLKWTCQALSADNLDYLSKIPRGPIAHEGLDLVHGSPLDEDAYLVRPADIAPVLLQMRIPLTFFGHTHVQGGFLGEPACVTAIDPTCILHIQLDRNRYLVNPGSVGQPRDCNWRAAYALYSSEEQRVEFARVPYNVGPTAEKIVLAGMPATFAARFLMAKGIS